MRVGNKLVHPPSASQRHPADKARHGYLLEVPGPGKEFYGVGVIRVRVNIGFDDPGFLDGGNL